MVDADGVRTDVLVYQTLIESRTLADAPTWLPGLKRLCTRAGSHVNDNGDGTYTEVSTGRVLTRV